MRGEVRGEIIGSGDYPSQRYPGLPFRPQLKEHPLRGRFQNTLDALLLGPRLRSCHPLRPWFFYEVYKHLLGFLAVHAFWGRKYRSDFRKRLRQFSEVHCDLKSTSTLFVLIRSETAAPGPVVSGGTPVLHD